MLSTFSLCFVLKQYTIFANYFTIILIIKGYTKAINNYNMSFYVDNNYNYLNFELL